MKNLHTAERSAKHQKKTIRNQNVPAESLQSCIAVGLSCDILHVSSYTCCSIVSVQTYRRGLYYLIYMVFSECFE